MNLGSARAPACGPSRAWFRGWCSRSRQGQWVLYRIDENGGFVGDTWHGTHEDAVRQIKRLRSKLRRRMNWLAIQPVSAGKPARSVYEQYPSKSASKFLRLAWPPVGSQEAAATDPRAQDRLPQQPGSEQEHPDQPGSNSAASDRVIVRKPPTTDAGGKPNKTVSTHNIPLPVSAMRIGNCHRDTADQRKQ